MSFVSEKIAIESYVQANLTGTDIVFGNVQAPVDSAIWTRVNILNSKASQVSLGNNPVFRYVGLVIFQVFTKTDIGSRSALNIADAITGLFRAQSISGITYKTPEIDIVGDIGAWFQLNVSVPFFREE